MDTQESQTENLTCGEEINYTCNEIHDIDFDNLNDENISEIFAKVSLNGDATGIKTIANVDTVLEAVGLINQKKIITGKESDNIVGVATTQTTESSIASSQREFVSDNFALVAANSESSILINATAVGVDNQGIIRTNKGNDAFVGLANNTAVVNSEATALTTSITNIATEDDISAMNEIEAAIALSNANATAISLTTTLGIINSGKILAGQGNDVIFGLANNTSEIDVQAIAEAESKASDIARAVAEANSLGIVAGVAVGIVNSNLIDTGKGNDFVIGIAVNNATVNSNAQANAVANALDSDTQTNSDSIADISETIAIGIDNTSGLLKTSQGDDQIIGVGTAGISGGNFRLGQGNDSIIGYGSAVGVDQARINLGQGDDLFQSAIVNVDPVSGVISFPDDQSGSIKNTTILGGQGNDTFELGGFEEDISIDGGQDYDELRLGGNLDDYHINLNPSGNRSLYIKDLDATLSVKNVESFYFRGSDRTYTFEDFA